MVLFMKILCVSTGTIKILNQVDTKLNNVYGEPAYCAKFSAWEKEELCILILFRMFYI